MCICLLNIRSIELATCTYPAHEVLGFSSESVHDIGVGGIKAPGYFTESLCDYFNWIMHALQSHCLFTLSLHWQLTSKAQNGNHSCTLLHHWAGLNVTTLPWFSDAYFLSDDPYHTDGRTDGWTDRRTDKNRQTIAVTLCLRFAARVKNACICNSIGMNRQSSRLSTRQTKYFELRVL